MASFSSSFPIDSSLLLHLPNNANFVQLNYQRAARTLDNHGIINHKFCNNEASVMSTVMTSRNSSTSMDASSLVTTDHQQKDDVVKKKRKCKEGSFANSAQSKDKREKKQRKMKNIGEVKEIKVCKEESKEAPTGYILVRARRGQATDRHSLAERVRRERISERMKLLQSLVPGCDKVTGKALVLDEIINYVQSLQNQVEVLSMRLASTNPMFLDFGMDIEPFMDQNLSNLASPILPSMQGYNPATASAQVQDDLPLENRQVLYDMDEQSQIFIRQCTGFSNNLHSCN